MSIETITIPELQTRMKAQGVSAREHIAFVCPRCATVQSMSLLGLAGVPAERQEAYIGFSCVGRFLNSGPSARGAKAPGRPGGVGCDWTLGGLFSLHELQVDRGDGEKPQPSFAIATAEQAVTLEAGVKAGTALPNVAGAA